MGRAARDAAAPPAARAARPRVSRRTDSRRVWLDGPSRGRQATIRADERVRGWLSDRGSDRARGRDPARQPRARPRRRVAPARRGRAGRQHMHAARGAAPHARRAARRDRRVAPGEMFIDELVDTGDLEREDNGSTARDRARSRPNSRRGSASCSRRPVGSAERAGHEAVDATGSSPTGPVDGVRTRSRTGCRS